LCSDIINPSPRDPYFPITRCRDWFAGHSWASGIANGAGSRDQESSGEAINGYYGALLWASVALSQDYVNFAKLLLATEQQAAQVYWHLYPEQSATGRDNPYPEQDMRELVTMGNVMDWQSGAWLFWGNQRVQIAAIQILPLIPANEVCISFTGPCLLKLLLTNSRCCMTRGGLTMSGSTRCQSYWIPRLETNGK